MADSRELQQIVERIVAQVFERQMPKLQAELVQQVISELPSSVSDPADGVRVQPPKGLAPALASIYAGGTQKEILRALLDAGSAYASRVALFVVKAGSATGWQARGMGNDEAIKDFALDMTSRPAARAHQERVAAPANVDEMDQRFVKQFGRPQNDQILILPLLLKDKVAALLYADGGAAGLLDAASLEVLVMATSAWLEVTSLRKQAHKDGTEHSGAADQPPAAAPVHAATSFSDPFAGHAPHHAAAAPTPVQHAAETVSASSAAAAPGLAVDPLAGLSTADADAHRKAQRFARLLVDEIKLYNQAKVAEGRRHRDLYDRLKDDIDKSRMTFQKRYGATVAGAADYLDQELIRSLAEDDLSVMGPNFKS
jgi:hypothetical protein